MLGCEQGKSTGERQNTGKKWPEIGVISGVRWKSSTMEAPWNQ